MPYILLPFLSSWPPIDLVWRSDEPRPCEGYHEPYVGRVRSVYEEVDLPIQWFIQWVPVSSFSFGCHETRVMLAILAMLVLAMLVLAMLALVYVNLHVVVQQALPVPGPVVGDGQKDAFIVSWKILS